MFPPGRWRPFPCAPRLSFSDSRVDAPSILESGVPQTSTSLGHAEETQRQVGDLAVPDLQNHTALLLTSEHELWA